MECSCKSLELAVLIKRMHIKSYFAIKDRVGMIEYYPQMEGMHVKFYYATKGWVGVIEKCSENVRAIGEGHEEKRGLRQEKLQLV